MAKDRFALGVELRRLREGAGMTQRDLAAALTAAGHRVSTSAVGQWEKGRWTPSPEHVRALEQILQPPPTLAFLAGMWGPTPVDHERRLCEVERRVDELGRTDPRQQG